jgi:hypothetical protein
VRYEALMRKWGRKINYKDNCFFQTRQYVEIVVFVVNALFGEYQIQSKTRRG